MDLPREVQASIIRVAGDWSLAIANKKYPIIDLKSHFWENDFLDALRDNFEAAYQSLSHIVRE